MVFRQQNHVPDVYVRESRDFQLFCRLYDSVQQGTRFQVRNMVDSLSPEFANNRILTLMAARVGFTTRKYIDDSVLRYIIGAFPYAIKNKGTKVGIAQAVYAILKAENADETPTVLIDSASHTVNIYTYARLINRVALEEFLKYIVPTGYLLKFNVGIPYTGASTPIQAKDSVALEIKSGEELGVIGNYDSGEQSTQWNNVDTLVTNEYDKYST